MPKTGGFCSFDAAARNHPVASAYRYLHFEGPYFYLPFHFLYARLHLNRCDVVHLLALDGCRVPCFGTGLADSGLVYASRGKVGLVVVAVVVPFSCGAAAGTGILGSPA